MNQLMYGNNVKKNISVLITSRLNKDEYRNMFCSESSFVFAIEFTKLRKTILFRRFPVISGITSKNAVMHNHLGQKLRELENKVQTRENQIQKQRTLKTS